MNALFDTNVILDVLLDREPFSNDASYLLTKIERSEISGFICATTLTTIHYLAAKVLGAKAANKQIQSLLSLFEIAPVNRIVIENAVASKFNDFEDAVLHEAACHAGAEYIVTMDIGGFKSSKLPVFTPSEFINILGSLAGDTAE
jgi:predicted nucleic acid-binding protein